MIWVEILSRQRDVTARYRIAARQVRIGRGYENDVVVDDAYVAANHLRIFRNQTGQLMAEDMGSANGTFIEGSKVRLTSIALHGSNPIQIGQTFLRVREVHHAVELERIARPERRILPILLAVVLMMLVLGVAALKVWLSETSEPLASSYMTPLLTLVAIPVVWAGLWAVLSRIISGHFRFLRNLLIGLSGLFAVMLFDPFAEFSAFALNWLVVDAYEYVAAWLMLAVVCFLHLREISRARLWLKGAIVMTVLIAAIAAQTLQQMEEFSDDGRQNTAHFLMPQALRIVPVSDQTAFFNEIAKLKADLDAITSKSTLGNPSSE
jgi:hypothetical protein